MKTRPRIPVLAAALGVLLAAELPASAAPEKVQVEIAVRRTRAGQRPARRAIATGNRMALHGHPNLVYLRTGTVWHQLAEAAPAVDARFSNLVVRGQRGEHGLSARAHVPALRLQLALASRDGAEIDWDAEVSQVSHRTYLETGGQRNVNPTRSVLQNTGLLDVAQIEELAAQAGDDLSAAYRRHGEEPLVFDMPGARVLDIPVARGDWQRRMVVVFRTLTLGADPLEVMIPVARERYWLEIGFRTD